MARGNLVRADQAAHRLPGVERGAFGGRVGRGVQQRPTHGVSAVPGVTQVTLIPSATWSAAMASVSA